MFFTACEYKKCLKYSRSARTSAKNTDHKTFTPCIPISIISQKDTVTSTSSTNDLERLSRNAWSRTIIFIPTQMTLHQCFHVSAFRVIYLYSTHQSACIHDLLCSISPSNSMSLSTVSFIISSSTGMLVIHDQIVQNCRKKILM